MPTSPSLKTVKRLFALSGNLCAFPSCSAQIIDVSGSVLGEICHIRARSSDGPRYDPSQTDEERHGFDNLLLMCSSHHKIVDDSPGDYTVEKLLDFKRASQSEASNPWGGISEITLQQLIDEIDNIKSSNSQTVNGTGIFVAGPDARIYTGISYQDARAIAHDVYKANTLELQQVAARVAAERAERVTEEFLKRLEGNPASLCALANPDMQYALFDAQLAAARSTDSNLHGVLVDLLTDRAREDGADFMRLVLNESIKTAGRLTADQFDALSVVFLLRHAKFGGIESLESLSSRLQDTAGSIILTASRTQARFQYLQFCGCGSIEPHIVVSRLLAHTYPEALVRDVPRERIRSVLGGKAVASDEVLSQLFCAGRLSDSLSMIPANFDSLLRQAFAQLEWGAPQIDRFWRAMRKLAEQILKERISKEEGSNLWVGELASLWIHPLSAFRLTSVGIAIALANLRRRNFGPYDMSIWIN